MTTEALALTTHAADIVSAYVANNAVRAADLPDLIASVHGALVSLGQPAAAEPEPQREPAVPVKKSIAHDHVTCLDCGKQFKSLRRHIGRSHGLTPAAYRQRWLLPESHPIVAPAYAEVRSKLAKDIGLGTKPEATPAAAEAVAA